MKKPKPDWTGQEKLITEALANTNEEGTKRDVLVATLADTQAFCWGALRQFERTMHPIMNGTPKELGLEFRRPSPAAHSRSGSCVAPRTVGTSVRSVPPRRSPSSGVQQGPSRSTERSMEHHRRASGRTSFLLAGHREPHTARPKHVRVPRGDRAAHDYRLRGTRRGSIGGLLTSTELLAELLHLESQLETMADML